MRYHRKTYDTYDVGLTEEEFLALEKAFTRHTGRTFRGRDALWIDLTSVLEETGSCEIPAHLTKNKQPVLLERRGLI